MEILMEKEVVVKFTDVTKVYKLYKSDRARFKGLFSSKVKYKTNKAVNNLSFEVRRGESVALFGRNGAGKSTILKMVTGVTFPTEGEVYVNGSQVTELYNSMMGGGMMGGGPGGMGGGPGFRG